MVELEEKRFHTGEISINYAEGPSNGPPLVLVPPQGADWTNYQNSIPLLVDDFHVYVLDVRGHGKSDWTTGDYSFDSIGRDMTAFLEHVVQESAIISGNSSGGLIALWCAANIPGDVRGIIMEDPPLFSAEWPRIKEEYVYQVLQATVEMSRELTESRSVGGLARCFMKVKKPLPSGKMTSIPRSAAYLVSFLVRASQKLTGGSPSLPGRLGRVLEVLTTFDPDFSQAWLDGRIYEGLDHAEALRRAQRPMLLIQANWHRHPEYGLVGAMDDDDAAHAREVAPDMCFKQIDSEHVVHSYDPEAFVHIVREFISHL
ncbi:MAG: alpha/beta fold hydrolase [Candidatus Thorarchaeota archaeon]|nr:alpha/beta fold hydrolase [Candidatus Thorarchaeota archaeon]